MTDPIDTDAIRDDVRSVRRAHGINAEALLLAPWWMTRTVALCDEVDALRAQAIPDGHTRIDGKVYRVDELASLDGWYHLVPLEES